jgi:hypothetical protein
LRLSEANGGTEWNLLHELLGHLLREALSGDASTQLGEVGGVVVASGLLGLTPAKLSILRELRHDWVIDYFLVLFNIISELTY